MEVNDFDFRLATSRRFFEIYGNKTAITNEHRILGEFLLEIALFETDKIRQCQDSLLAMAALLVSAHRIRAFDSEIEANRSILKRVHHFLSSQSMHTLA